MLSFGIKHALWDSTISGVYHSFRANSWNTFRKPRKAGKRFVQSRSFIRIPKKTLTGLKNPQNCLFPSHLFFRQSWTKVLGHFCVSGRFPIHTDPTPPLTPQTMLDSCIQNFFWVSTLNRVGGRENCKKISKMMHCFKREPINDRKYEYCSTVPRTFVQDCRSPMDNHFSTFRRPRWNLGAK